jgi:site-specific recombinase XerD
LRHTGATAAVRAGIRDFALAELLGHASTRTTARYVHLQPDDLRGLFDRVRASEREKRTPTIAPNRSKPPQTGF